MLRLRQIAMVAPDLAPVEEAVGQMLAAEVCYRDPGVGKYGLHNALWALSGTFLEALAPLQENTTAGRYLARRGGATGYMVILDTDDLAPVRDRLAVQGTRIVEDLTVGDAALHATALHLHPRDTGGCLLSIDHHGPDGGMMGSYMWAGSAWHAQANASLAISGAMMTCVDTQTDSTNCGMCGTTCPLVPNALASCAMGACASSSARSSRVEFAKAADVRACSCPRAKRAAMRMPRGCAQRSNATPTSSHSAARCCRRPAPTFAIRSRNTR